MITHEITLDMQQPGRTIVLHAPQGEIEARQVQIKLVNQGLPWAAPLGAAMTVSYKRRNGSGGSYETLADGTTPAVSLNGVRTVATVRLIEEVLAYGGVVEMNLTFLTSSQCTITTSWIFAVHPLGGKASPAPSGPTYNGEVENGGGT